MTFVLILLLLIFLSIVIYLRHPKFGRKPGGDRLLRIQNSPNYRNGQFQNLSITPQLVEGYKISGIIYAQIFKKVAGRKPATSIPAVKTDLRSLPIDNNLIVWFGHSSYYMQVAGKRFLVDPVFSSNASPIPGTNRPFPGTDIYHAEDVPDIDYLLITHDHYDHLDYETIVQLRGRVGTIICGLGVGEHFERWGFAMHIVQEMDWNEEISLSNGMKLHSLPARHFSGRSFSRNNTLWMSFLLQSPHISIYMGGDSGYDSHFTNIGEKFGVIDLAILDNGQYNEAWRYIHAMPEDVIKAAIDLKAKRLLPVHSSKFVMANHRWDEPLTLITELNKKNTLPILTPKIGEVVKLDSGDQEFKRWWDSDGGDK